MSDRYAVLGNPIKHSKSPDIHHLFAQQCRHDISYEKHCVEPEAFKEFVHDFFANGGLGLNITVPFKEQAFEVATELSPRAKAAGAVNFLMPTESGIKADNTDGFGLVLDITQNLAWEIKNKRVLILGAGGAVRGVLLPLLDQQPEVIVVANRTVEKAKQLAKEFSQFGNISGRAFWQDDELPFDIIINGTSASLQGDVPNVNPLAISKTTCAYDMVYGNEATPFMQWAEQQGAHKVADGFGMLVGQAAESYRLWRGVMPDIAKTIEALRGK